MDKTGTKKDQTALLLVARGQEGNRRECLCSGGTVEDGAKLVISLMKRRLHTAHDSLARSFTEVSLTHWMFCVCVCVCINSIGKQLSSDSAAARG